VLLPKAQQKQLVLERQRFAERVRAN
jgi:hypothetical protein